MGALAHGEAAVFLANVERSFYGHTYGNDECVDGDSDNDDESCDGHGCNTIVQVIEQTTEISILTRPDGTVWARRLPLDKDRIVRDDAITNTSSKEDWQCCQRNLVPCIGHQYRRTCLVVMPKRLLLDFEIQFMIGGQLELHEWAGRKLQESEEHPTEAERNDIIRLASFCNHVVGTRQTAALYSTVGYEYIGTAMTIAYRLRSVEMSLTTSALTAELHSDAVLDEVAILV
jgi:hypothetical protein